MNGRGGLAALATLATCAFIAGCGIVEGRACTTEFVFGLNVEVRTASGGTPPEGTVVEAVDGHYRETLERFGETTFLGAGEREGTYDVTVTAPGHATWKRDDVEVDGDACHVHGVALDAVLQPAG